MTPALFSYRSSVPKALFVSSHKSNAASNRVIVCVHPGSSVKEQTARLYANQPAISGFIAFTFDASFQGESGGEPRFSEDPATRIEDIR